MSMGSLGHTALSRSRTSFLALLCLVATVAGFWAAALVWSGSGARPGSFEWLVGVTAIVPLLGGCCWLTLVTGVLVLEAFTESRPRSPRWMAAPAALRALAIASTGVALGVSVTGPAQAAMAPATADAAIAGAAPTHTMSLDGLRLPARIQGGARSPVTGTHEVRPGESLWSIARSLAPQTTDAGLLDLVERLHAHNRATIGGDPDLLQPGMVLHTAVQQEGAVR